MAIVTTKVEELNSWISQIINSVKERDRKEEYNYFLRIYESYTYNEYQDTIIGTDIQYNGIKSTDCYDINGLHKAIIGNRPHLSDIEYNPDKKLIVGLAYSQYNYIGLSSIIPNSKLPFCRIFHEIITPTYNTGEFLHFIRHFEIWREKK